jgi:hypothetical protein
MVTHNSDSHYLGVEDFDNLGLKVWSFRCVVAKLAKIISILA